ncbi:hypothetical protein ACFOMD_04460 [Sphingoaurantiacus capsulatus]|uniref:Glutamine amidotransferase domain-containing protein n=1 Tax=Sphingoaurantiacus capsulatus TaxID=1771310 RepID=A0ABV7X6P0_9SPHN
MIAFDPLVPLWLLGALGLALAVTVALALPRARRTIPLRAAIAFAALLLLANPVRRIEERERQTDIAVAVVDRSRSMEVNGGKRHADAAVTALRRAAPDVDWRIVEARPEPGAATRLMPTLDRALRDVPADRLAGALLITDGIVREATDASALPPERPVHLLLGGNPEVRDRRLVVTRVPPYSVVGRPAAISVRIDDGPDASGTARLDWLVNGVAQPAREVPVGEVVTLPVPVDRRGDIEVALSVAPMAAGEATLVNNRALVRLNGVRDRLRVLLVSGVPYPGGRVWRDTLKSDPNIDLVHFTILRLPTSYDPTPSDELALIPFPVEELFEEQLGRFDLVILDRFGLTELLSPGYFGRLVAYVRDGGGMLVVAGDEYAEAGGLADTLLREILPAVPSGPVVTRSFTPALSDVGRRHPVTASLAGPWGAWGEQADVRSSRAQVLMTGVDDRPLLMLDRQGKGRIGLLASTNVWWWARAVEGDGPRDELLRRTVHWLMQEPDLAEDRLDVRARGRKLDIVARGVNPPTRVQLTGPDGASRLVALNARPDANVAEATVPEDGLYRVDAEGMRRFVLAGDVAELSEIRPRPAPLETLATASDGGSFGLAAGVPDIRRTSAGARQAGGNWLGLVRNDGGRLVGVREEPLLPPWAAWGLLTALLAAAWWRERA